MECLGQGCTCLEPQLQPWQGHLLELNRANADRPLPRNQILAVGRLAVAVAIVTTNAARKCTVSLPSDGVLFLCSFHYGCAVFFCHMRSRAGMYEIALAFSCKIV